MAEALNMTLAQRLGKDEAHQLVQSVSRRVASDGADLRRAALEGWRVRAVLGPDAIDAALDPAAYLGSTSPLIDRALRRFEAMRSVGAVR